MAEDAGVLALGGGAPVDPRTEQLLVGQTVVFLDVGIADASKRVGFDQSRPLLAVNPRASWVRLMNERRPVYERVATFRVDTGGPHPAGHRGRGRAVCWGSRERRRRPERRHAPPSSGSATPTTSSSGTACPTGSSGLLGDGVRQVLVVRPDALAALRGPRGRAAREPPGSSSTRPAVPDNEAAKTAEVAAAAVGDARAARLHPLGCRRRRRGRHGHRPRGVRRGHLAARGGRGARADDPARDGRRRRRGQDRHQHRRGQEPRRGVPRAGRGALRPRRAGDAAARPTSWPGWPRWSRRGSSPTR